MSSAKTARLTDWQRRCHKQLKASAAEQPNVLRINQHKVDDGSLYVQFTLSTIDIGSVANGLQLEPEETFVVVIPADGEKPPQVYVEHFRFLGTPHVLSGFLICLYLDPTREWDPAYGMNGHRNAVLNRLWRWLETAAEDGFDANEALYHAVGGLPQISRGPLPIAPVVVRELPRPRGRVAQAWLRTRSDWCLQLHPTMTAEAKDNDHVPVFFPEYDLPFGAGADYLLELAVRLDLRHVERVAKLRRREGVVRLCEEPPPLKLAHIRTAQAAVQNTATDAIENASGHTDCPLIRTYANTTARGLLRPSVALLTALAASASRKPPGSPQVLFIAVPHPQGGPRHLIAVHLNPKLGDHLRNLVQSRTTPTITFKHARLDGRTPLEWCYVSDERPEVTKRRDTNRPVNAYQDKTVLIWGVGGLGSWAAEYVIRAGAKRVIVCDNGIVTGGLLVRQNYTDQDVGAAKADRLASRLAAIFPDVDIEPRHDISDADLAQFGTSAHLIIDATINRVVAKRLDTLATNGKRTATIAQIATDARTGTLGIATINSPESTGGLLDHDRNLGTEVLDAADLEPYHVFWQDPEPSDEFVPTRGCSIPTFHGSAADLAGVTASLITLIGPHLHHPTSGTYLIALPHSGVTPAYTFLPLTALTPTQAA